MTDLTANFTDTSSEVAAAGSADSAVRGYPAHEALDMIPQGKHPNFYLPVMPELPLSSRRFPAPGAFSTLSG